MDEFYLTPLNEIDNPKFKFYKLYRNGKNFFEDFVASLKQKSDLEEIDSIIALMDKVDNNNLPTSKFRHITGKKKDRKDIYEFKSKHLRVYAIKKEPDMYLLLGGFKKSQDADIEKVFRYFNNIPDKLVVKEEEEYQEK